MKHVPENQKFLIANQDTYGPDFHCPNPRGWYHSVGGVVKTPEGLVATYRLSDAHCAVYTHIMVAYSKDGRNWEGHRSISLRNVWEDHSVWIAPQLSQLKDGRLVIISDLGHRTPQKGWPMLTLWQKPDRGMSNWLFWSDDHGRTWSDPVKIDDVGGEPGYIAELSDGTLVYTRTESNQYPGMYDPPQPWNDIYYRNTAVFSDDGGKTWDRTSIITDAPYHGDCEVGIVELEPNHLMAVTRIGFGNAQFGQPSRLVHSYDNGKTWEKPVLAPFYGQRTIARKLKDGRVFVSYRNRLGTPGVNTVAFNPDTTDNFQPTSMLVDPDRADLKDGQLTLRAGGSEKDDSGIYDGSHASRADEQAYYIFYPVITDLGSAAVEVEARLDPQGSKRQQMFIRTGFRINIEPTALFFDAVPDQRHELDASEWHTYRLERSQGKAKVFVDGKLVLEADRKDVENRHVGFGADRPSLSQWRSAKVKVDNPDDYSIQWSWNAKDGHPDQFRQDHITQLDLGGGASDCGYGGWTQLDDGTAVVVDYTNAHYLNSDWQMGPRTFLRAYHIKPQDI